MDKTKILELEFTMEYEEFPKQKPKAKHTINILVKYDDINELYRLKRMYRQFLAEKYDKGIPLPKFMTKKDSNNYTVDLTTPYKEPRDISWRVEKTGVGLIVSDITYVLNPEILSDSDFDYLVDLGLKYIGTTFQKK